MAKTTRTFPLQLPTRRADAPANEWLAEGLRRIILGGSLRPGSRLPSTRDLARDYGLSRGTIVRAFEQLKAEGYLQGAVGSGTFVRRVLPDELLQVRSRRDGKRGDGVRVEKRRALSAYGRRARSFRDHDAVSTRAFRANQPALDLFPTTLWARLAARRLRFASQRLLGGSDALGYRPLREAIADYLQVARGVRCSWQQVAIVSGVQEGLDLITRVLVEPGGSVCIEDPGYVGASRAFEAYGATIFAMPVDEEGAIVPPPSLRNVRLAYLTPAHQFPLGVCMSITRRLAFLDWARRCGALIFEDDYDSEYRYSGHPIPALQGLDEHECVVLAGTFSKVLFPSLRLGYLVIAPDLVDPIAAVKSLSSRYAPVLDQAVLCDFITENHFARHLRRMREIYAERLSVLLEYGRQKLSGLLDISSVEAGLETVGWLPPDIDAVSAAKAASTHDVEVIPLSAYSRRPSSREGLQLGFAAVDATELRRGVRELERTLRRMV